MNLVVLLILQGENYILSHQHRLWTGMVHTYTELVMMKLLMSTLQSPKILQLYPSLAPTPELQPNSSDPASNMEWSGIQDGDFPSDSSGQPRLSVPAKHTQKGSPKSHLNHENHFLNAFTWTTSLDTHKPLRALGVTSPILQLKKTRSREVALLTQLFTTLKCRAGVWDPTDFLRARYGPALYGTQQNPF